MGFRLAFSWLRVGLLVSHKLAASFGPSRGLPDPEACSGAVRGTGSRLKS